LLGQPGLQRTRQHERGRRRLIAPVRLDRVALGLGLMVEQRGAALLELGLRDDRLGHLAGRTGLLVRQLGLERPSVPDRAQDKRQGARGQEAPDGPLRTTSRQLAARYACSRSPTISTGVCRRSPPGP
jgi:hypothetical protein